MFDHQYWHDQFLTVKTYEDAEKYIAELTAILSETPVEECDDEDYIGDSCLCPEKGKLCLEEKVDLLSLAGIHFMKLGLPVSILEGLEKNEPDHCLTLTILDEVPDINLLLRCPKLMEDKISLDRFFEDAVSGGYVDFARELLERGLVNPSSAVMYFPPNQEMIKLLTKYNIHISVYELMDFSYLELRNID